MLRHAIPASLLLLGCLSGCDSSVKAAKSAVSDQLLDPRSAQFQHVRSNDGRVCGQVNAKNRLGSYVGFEDFLVGPKGVVFEKSLSNFLMGTEHGKTGKQGLIEQAEYFSVIRPISGKPGLNDYVAPASYEAMLRYCSFLRAKMACTGESMTKDVSTACELIGTEVRKEWGDIHVPTF